MRWDDYNQIISEHFDIHNRENRKILLSINEEDQNHVMMSLAGKLYTKIVDKVDDIDYGQIPASKGDITKIPNFLEMKECLQIIRDLLLEYHTQTDTVDVVLHAISNLEDSKNLWERAFDTKCEMPILFYNTIALSIVSAVSLLMTNCIEYIKDPVEGNFNITLEKSGLTKTKNHMLFKNLEEFNKAYKKGEIKKVMEAFLNGKRKIDESSQESREVIQEEVMTTIVAGVFIGITVIMLLKIILLLLRELVVLFYSMKQSISDYFLYQSDLLLLNAENVRLNTTKTESEREKIYKKQMKTVERLKRYSNTFAIKFKSGENKAEKILKDEKKEKYDVKDVVTQIPTSASTDSIF